MHKIIASHLTPGALAPALTEQPMPQPRSEDETLARQFPDLRPQLQQPSLLRHTFDRQAQDSRQLYTPGQLNEYLFARAGQEQRPAAEATAEWRNLVADCYQLSPAFRRVFNHAVETRLINDDARLLPPGNHAAASARRILPDPLNALKMPREYQSEMGRLTASIPRYMLENLLPKLTNQPRNEAGHPRGAITELSNIILKELGETAPACTTLIAYRTTQAESSSAARSLQVQAEAGTVVPQARRQLESQANTRLQQLQSNTVSRDPLVRQRLQTEMAKTRDYAATLSALLMRVRPGDSPEEALISIAQQNLRSNMMSYNNTRSRDPFDMAQERQGDCSSFCLLYKALGQACGLPPLRLLSMEKPFTFRLGSGHHVPGVAKNQQMSFARHTILAFEDKNGATSNFDPIFGQTVNPAGYGKSLAAYLRP